MHHTQMVGLAFPQARALWWRGVTARGAERFSTPFVINPRHFSAPPPLLSFVVGAGISPNLPPNCVGPRKDRGRCLADTKQALALNANNNWVDSLRQRGRWPFLNPKPKPPFRAIKTKAMPKFNPEFFIKKNSEAAVHRRNPDQKADALSVCLAFLPLSPLSSFSPPNTQAPLRWCWCPRRRRRRGRGACP